MLRRHFLSSTAVLGGTIGSSTFTPLLAQQGPVFMDYTQEQLDQAYDQAVWAPQFAELQAGALQGMGQLASRTVVFATNHFQEPQRLAKPDSEVSRVLFSLMII